MYSICVTNQQEPINYMGDVPIPTVLEVLCVTLRSFVLCLSLLFLDVLGAQDIAGVLRGDVDGAVQEEGDVKAE